MRQNASLAARGSQAGRRGRMHASGRSGRALEGGPERFARPRIVLCAVVFALLAFGLLMVYSSSSIVALTSKAYGNNPAYFFQRQLVFVGAGTLALVVLAKLDYHLLTSRLFVFVESLIATVLLLMVLFSPSGADAYGATRWINLGGFTLQPSELAKVSVILAAARALQDYFDGGEDNRSPLAYVACILVPMLLILIQPDKGTTMILAATLVVMFYLSGGDRRVTWMLVAVGVGVFLFLALKDDYSRRRIVTMFNPWADPYDTGYQLIQGFYAFGSGGLLGVGIGASRQKYSYLPMAYNDFIYAVVGEECGLVGTLGVLAGFALVLWAGFRIARFAPDLSGRLIAAGSVSMLVIQLFVNICGVLGIMPLTGKPVPFLSYGGSSIISCLMIVGLVLSVSLHSHLEETESDRRRSSMRLASRPTGNESGMVGEAQPRSARTRDERGGRGLRVIEGGAGARGARTGRSVGRTSRQEGRAAPRGRVTTDANGRRRVDLGPDPADRLYRAHRNASDARDAGRGRGRDGRRGH